MMVVVVVKPVDTAWPTNYDNNGLCHETVKHITERDECTRIIAICTTAFEIRPVGIWI